MELSEIGASARSRNLSRDNTQGGSFSITKLGSIGGVAFMSIINAPEVANLGVSRASVRLVYQGDQFVPRLLLPLSLSYDHRVIDGAAAVRFMKYSCAVLSDIRRLSL